MSQAVAPAPPPSWRARSRDAIGWALRQPVRASVIGLALVTVLAAPIVWRLVDASSWRVAGTGGAEAYLWGLGWAALLGAALLAWPVPKAHRATLLLLWWVKVLVALGFMLVYEAHYMTELDAYGYFLRGMEEVDWSQAALAGIWPIDTLVWLMLWVVPDSYHAVKVTLAYGALAGTYFLWRATRDVWPEHRLASLVVLALVPSVLFWSSILGKDPLVVLGLGLACFGAVGLAKRRWGRAIPFLLGIGLVILVRPWIAWFALAALAWAAWLARGGAPPAVVWRRARASVAWGIVLGLAFLWVTTGTALADRLVARLNYTSHVWAYGGSAQRAPVFTSLWHALAFLPLGAFTAWFRPLPGEVPSLFGTMAGLEGAALLALVVWTAARGARERLRDPALLWGLAFLALWSVLYAFLSYQNLGTGARFRMQALPIALLVMARLLWKRPPGP